MFLKLAYPIIFLLITISASSEAVKVKKLLGWMYNTRGTEVDVTETGHVLAQLMGLNREKLDERDEQAISDLEYLVDLEHYSIDKCYHLDEAKKLRSKAVNLMLVNLFTLADFIVFHVNRQAEYCAKLLPDLVKEATRLSNLKEVELLMEPIKGAGPRDEELVTAVAEYLKRVAPQRKKSSFNVLGKMKSKEKHATAFSSGIVDSICQPLIDRMKPINDLLVSFDKHEIPYELDTNTKLWLERDTHCTDIIKNGKAITEMSYKKMMKDLNKKGEEEEVEDAESGVDDESK